MSKSFELRVWAVLQAEALDFKGPKVYESSFGPMPAVFVSKESAREYLRTLLVQIKHEQSIGWRTEDNLERDKKLDFYIREVSVSIPQEVLTERGWTHAE